MTEDAGMLLREAARGGVYRVSDNHDAVRAAAGSWLARVRLAEVAGKESLLSTLAESLGFPAWFGGNWDALEDCLCDLSWRSAKGHVLLFEDYAQLRESHPDEFGVLLDVLDAAADYWRGRGIPFFALFVDPESALALPQLFERNAR